MTRKIDIFCCYARKDQDLLLDFFGGHMKSLEWQGLITLWSDTDINAGVAWEAEIHKHLNSAHIILLFVSPDFMQSNYCFSKEMRRALERHEAGEARVIPIILRHVSWEGTPLGKLQALPTDADPVISSRWHTKDQAFRDVAKGIEKTVKELLATLPDEAFSARPAAAVPVNQVSQTALVEPVLQQGNVTGLQRLGETHYFSGFTERANKVLNLAPAEAARLQHNYIGTEHLLLALIREGGGAGISVLRNLGVDPERVRGAVEFIITRGERVVLGELALTPRSKKVINLSANEARRFRRDYIGTEHLLLGMIAEGEGIAAGVLESLGVNLANARAEVIRFFSLPIPDLPVESISTAGSSAMKPVNIKHLDVFRIFTDQAKNVIDLAYEEAMRFQHNYVGSEHLLLGLIREDQGIASAMLRDLGIDLGKIRSAVEFIIGYGERPVVGKIGLTPRFKKIIDLAQEEARLLHHRYIWTGHLLLGMVAEGEGISAGVLENLGGNLERVRQEAQWAFSYVFS
jgi:hypothetical protein